MPLFQSKITKCYIITSYKCLYTSFCSQNSLNPLYFRLSLRLFIRKLLFHPKTPSYFFVRNPYDRCLSLFTDKYRNQPARIHAAGFQWQQCHTVLYPHLGIDPNWPDDKIAQAFLNMDLNHFIEILPKIQDLDDHFFPQSKNLLIWYKNVCLPIKWPLTKIFRIEKDLALAHELTGIDFSIKKNKTSHQHHNQILKSPQYKILNHLYAKDFHLFDYPMKN